MSLQGLALAVDARRPSSRLRAGRDHAEPAVVVDVGGAHGHPRELAHQVGLLVGERRAGEHGERVAARAPPGCAGSRDAVRSSAASQPSSAEAPALDALERRQQPVRVLVLQVALHALGTELPAVEGELLPGLEADDLLVLHLELDAALLAAEAAVRLHEAVGLAVGAPAAGRHALGVRPEARHELRQSTRGGVAISCPPAGGARPLARAVLRERQVRRRQGGQTSW